MSALFQALSLHPGMRASHDFMNRSANMTANIIDIAPTATLTINMELNTNPKSKAKKPTSQRAVQRADGVVVERPQYKPSDAPDPRTSFACKKNMFFVKEYSKPKNLGRRPSNTMQIDLLYIGSFLVDHSRDENDKTLDCDKQARQKPYTKPTDENEYPDLLLDSCNSAFLVERFLLDSGPWSASSRETG